MSTNAWIDTNQSVIWAIKKRLTEIEFSGEHPDLPLNKMMQLYDSALFEVARLQGLVDAGDNKIKELEKGIMIKEEPDQKAE